MTDITQTHSEDLATFLADLMHRASVTLVDIEDKGFRILIHSDDIPDGLTQAVSDMYWVYISHKVTPGYVQIYSKKNLEELGFLT